MRGQNEELEKLKKEVNLVPLADVVEMVGNGQWNGNFGFGTIQSCENKMSEKNLKQRMGNTGAKEI